LWRMFDRSKALPRQACHGRQASLRVVFFGHSGFVGVGGWEVVAGRDVDLELGGFVAGELLVNGGEGAEEQAGDAGESGGAASGDVAAGFAELTIYNQASRREGRWHAAHQDFHFRLLQKWLRMT
jgi:hypothetical protein